ncbi:hypothetical protein nbrc107696_42020 [Gordonia spumicola]|uniref:Lipase n=1 Tax=Gordonia spumicola TaxID=589161 RepID=A0A7I9VEN5_9ACTN|nr:alpha/beta hydrolase [Gordonia spumicola]GEE03756.1 hypothetical protein nbrc107696_42020 [Gordonia spumicola]
MNAQPRRIEPAPVAPAPRRRSTATTTIGSVIVAAGMLVGGVTAAYAVATPDDSTPEVRGGQTPGTVFAGRAVPASDLPAAAATGQQFSYWTLGADERAHLSTATLLEPKGDAPAGGWKVVVYAKHPDGLSLGCAPSKRRAARDTAAVTGLLRSDYAVVVPDFTTVGVDGSPQYVDFGAAAHTIVDAVKAVGDVDPGVSSQWAAVGDSLGAGAVVQLAREATAWQKGKSDFRGAAATSLPVDYDELVAGLSPASAPVSAEKVTDVVFALASMDSSTITPMLSSRGKDLVTKARTLCAPALTTAIGSTSLSDLITAPISADTALDTTLREGLQLPTRGFSRPVLLSQKLIDDQASVPANLRYLTTAQLSSNKVLAKTYLTGSASDASRQEQAAVASFLKGLF